MGNKYNVLIIGAGNIGAFFDTPLDDKILTHAHAFSKVEGFNLIGFVDIDEKKAKKAAQIWNTNSFRTIEEAFINNIDIVCICTPDEYHFETLKKVSKFPIKLVFAEKPLTKNLQEATSIVMLYNKNKIPVMVNYSRRFVSEFEKIKCDIQNNKYGEFISGSGYYGKGVLHNGSHMIDFLRYAIGEIKDTNFINSNFDFYRDDPSISAILTFKNNKKFIMQSIPCSNYTIFEIDLLFEKKRVRIIDSGFKIEIYDVLDSEIFKTYKNLVKILEKETDLGKSLENAVMNIYNYLENKEKLICSLEDGFKAIKIVEMLKGEI